jgi:hypothetical protein
MILKHDNESTCITRKLLAREKIIRSLSVPSEAGFAVLHNPAFLLTYNYGCPQGRPGRRPAFMNTAKLWSHAKWGEFLD